MADFAAILAAVDLVWGTDGLAHYASQAATIAADTLGADPLLAALTEQTRRFVETTAAQLLAALTPTEDGWRAPREWPRNARAVTTTLRRNAPALRSAGWEVEDHGAANKTGTTTWTLTPPPPQTGPQGVSRDGVGESSPPSPPSPPPQHSGRSWGGEGGSWGGAGSPPFPAVPRQDHDKIGPSTREAGKAGKAGDELTFHPVTPPVNGDGGSGRLCQHCDGPISGDRAAYGLPTCLSCAVPA